MQPLPILMMSSLLACGAARAQTPGPATTPPQPSQSTMPSQGDANHASSGNSGMRMSDEHAALKSCVTQEQPSSPGMSKADAKRACKAQMKSQG
jgi:hypothetical protein